ncbi:MAG: type II toxin-antitoxin system VapC family toxin [Saprospiraceae bacterium]|nr:type II toxin-antitoxin system VapC family toxin [Saprospiraceae bacterium]
MRLNYYAGKHLPTRTWKSCIISIIFELESDIKRKTAEIRKAYKIKLPDAIIAATALAYDLTLLTRNVSDFKNIDGINLINPHEQYPPR